MRFFVKQFVCVCVCVCVTEMGEQRSAINVCVKLGESGVETFNKLKQENGENALSRSQLFKWL